MKTNQKYPSPAVVLGLSANGLSISRSLGRKGIPVIGISNHKDEPGIYSKYNKRNLVVPNIIDNKPAEEYLIKTLINLTKSFRGKAVLFPTADEYIVLISKNRDLLSNYFHFLLPSHELVECFIDKYKSYELAKKYQILFPKTFFANNESELLTISLQVKYPCIFKPLFSHVWREKYDGKKVIIVTSPQELIESYNKIKKIGDKVLIQEIVPGLDSNIYLVLAYFNKESAPLACFCCRKLRQHPPHFGIGSFVVSAYEPRIVNLGMDFLKKIKYKGLVGIEFKINSDTNTPIYIETNVRTTFIGEISVALGIDLPYIAYKNLVYNDNRIEEKNFTFDEGVKLTNITLDFGSFMLYRKNKELKFIDWIISFKSKKMAHTYFCSDDLMPFLHVYSTFIFYKIKRILFWGIAKMFKNNCGEKNEKSRKNRSE